MIDGDTIEVLHNQHPERIRLNGWSTEVASGKRSRLRLMADRLRLEVRGERPEAERKVQKVQVEGQIV